MRARILIAGALLGSAVVMTTPQAAGATISATTSGGTFTVTLVGDENVRLECSGGNAGVTNVTGGGFTAASPALACSAVTAVVVTGDFGDQTVDTRPLISAPFTANPTLGALLGDGNDVIWETDRNDTIFTGGDRDTVTLFAGTVANTTVNLGTGGSDQLTLEGTSSADTVAMASTTDDLTLTITGGATSSWTVIDAENISVSTGKGNDVASFAGVTGASGLGYLTLAGGDGDDTLTSSPKGTFLYGGTGTNTFHGGPGLDSIETESDTDTINAPTDTTTDYVDDYSSLRFGSRTLVGFGGSAQDRYSSGFFRNDVTLRVRPGSSGSALVTASLNRTGQQVLPAAMEFFQGEVEGTRSVLPDIAHRSLVDVVAVGQELSFSDTASPRSRFDVTIPTGSWTQTSNGTTRTIDPSAAGLGNIEIPATLEFRIHGPWTDTNQGFAHRIYRDLAFRFLSDDDRDFLRDGLTAGTVSRKQAVERIVDSDEYRGLDVDRTFVKYLRRPSDPGGRTYWINSIRNGRAMWRFRAQLFGGNEYFTKAGGTNALYVAKAYEDVLGRKPDPSGQAYWTNKLNNGADRGSVALQFINSAEARRRLVDDQFLRFLDRKPTAGEQTTWVNALTGATGEQDLIIFLTASSAYFNRS